MFAIVEASGRQFELVPGRFIDIDMTAEEEGTTHVFENVLMLVDGDKATIGQPFIKGAKVTGKVISKLEVNAVHGRIQSSIKSNKIIVYHQKPKKGTRKKQGHRSQYTRVMIEAIELDGKVVAKAEQEAKTAKAAKA
jgi:large subunit ribosomal protein L21